MEHTSRKPGRLWSHWACSPPGELEEHLAPPGRQWGAVLARAPHYLPQHPQPGVGWGRARQLLGLGSLCWRPQIPQEQEGEQEQPRAHSEADPGPCQPVHCRETGQSDWGPLGNPPARLSLGPGNAGLSCIKWLEQEGWKQTAEGSQEGLVWSLLGGREPPHPGLASQGTQGAPSAAPKASPEAATMGPTALARAPRLRSVPMTVPFCPGEPVGGRQRPSAAPQLPPHWSSLWQRKGLP